MPNTIEFTVVLEAESFAGAGLAAGLGAGLLAGRAARPGPPDLAPIRARADDALLAARAIEDRLRRAAEREVLTNRIAVLEARLRRMHERGQMGGVTELVRLGERSRSVPAMELGRVSGGSRASSRAFETAGAD